MALGWRAQPSHIATQASSWSIWKIQGRFWTFSWICLPVAPEDNSTYLIYRIFNTLPICSFCPTKKFSLLFRLKVEKVSSLWSTLKCCFFHRDLPENICYWIPLLGITPVCLANNAAQYIYLARKYMFVYPEIYHHMLILLMINKLYHANDSIPDAYPIRNSFL